MVIAVECNCNSEPEINVEALFSVGLSSRFSDIGLESAIRDITAGCYGDGVANRDKAYP